MEKRKKRKWIILLCVAVLLMVLMVWTVWSNGAAKLSNITVTSGNLPKSFDGYKIALVSDLHNAEFGENNIELIELLNKASPNIIAITGDIVDSHRTDIEIAVEFARQAAEIAPCYYVSGNHEGLLDKGEYLRLITGLESVGVTVLDNEESIIERNGEKISLIGINDPIIGENHATSEKIAAIPSFDGFTILLSHHPEIFDEYIGAGVDLALCGHAHGGQFRLPFIGGLYAPNQGFFPKYDAGLYTSGNSNMVVSRGVGNSVYPIRFNNRPEIVLIELKSEI